MLSLRSPWAGPLLRLINAALPLRHRIYCGLCNRAAVTSPTFTHQSLRVRLSAVTGTLLSSVMEKINSSGTEDGERYIMELMITSHSHKFTQIMQIKSYYELCSVYTLSIHCSDHFQWVIRGKFSMTISLLARRHRDVEGLILYRCVFFISSFFGA